MIFGSEQGNYTQVHHDKSISGLMAQCTSEENLHTAYTQDQDHTPPQEMIYILIIKTVIVIYCSYF